MTHAPSTNNKWSTLGAVQSSARPIISCVTSRGFLISFLIALSVHANLGVLLKESNQGFLQHRYEVTAYDTDVAEVPLIKLIVRNDPHQQPQNANPTNSFKIVSGNVNDVFDITNTGLLRTTKHIGDAAADNNGIFNLRVQLRQQAPNMPSFIDECMVIVNYVKINRYGPEWRLDSLKPLYIEENSKPGTFITQLRCIDRDYEPSRHQVLSPSSPRTNTHQFDQPGQSYGNIKYYIKSKGLTVSETNEFKLDLMSGNLTTRNPLDREVQDNYHLVVACEDSGKPEPLSSVTSLSIIVEDIDDNKPEFVFPLSRSQHKLPATEGYSETANYDSKFQRPTITFSVEEHQIKGLVVGEVKAIDRDLNRQNPISYCLIDGNDFQEFLLDRDTGTLYTNKSLDRERQSSYDLLIKAINDGSLCEEHMISNSDQMQPATDSSDLTKETSTSAQDTNVLKDLLLVKVEVLDINDNPPSFKRSVYRAGVHHKALINSLVTQVSANDPDNDINGTLSYKISEISMYRPPALSHLPQHPPMGASRGYRGHVVESAQSTTNDLMMLKLVQFPFKIDQQGNVYTQQILTQYPVSSMFLISIEASEQTEPRRVAKTKLEVYTYEVSNQLKMRVNLHPRIIEAYRYDIEASLTNATKYTAIVSRARSYYGSSHTEGSNSSPPLLSRTRFDDAHGDDAQKTSTNIHLIFVDNYSIVNPSIIMEKFDLTSAQLFTPQLLTQMQLQHQAMEPTNKSSAVDQVRVNEVSSLIDKIALASVSASTEYVASSSSFVSVDWLESPSALIVSIGVMLFISGFFVCLFGCCCKSRIKNHIIKSAMDKLVKQQNIQAKINERVLAATGSQLSGFNGPNNLDFLNSQAGYISSFDATKGCATNNHENMNILQRAIDAGDYIEPGYNTLNGHYNMGAHFYDTSDMDQQHHNGAPNMNGKQIDETNVSISLPDESEGDENELKNNNQLMNAHAKVDSFGNARQRQQVPQNK